MKRSIFSLSFFHNFTIPINFLLALTWYNCFLYKFTNIRKKRNIRSMKYSRLFWPGSRSISRLSRFNFVKKSNLFSRNTQPVFAIISGDSIRSFDCYLNAMLSRIASLDFERAKVNKITGKERVTQWKEPLLPIVQSQITNPIITPW